MCSAIATGDTFGRLTVLNQVGAIKQFRCLCACGNEKTVKSFKLLSGHTASCGCGRRETPQKHMVKKAALANQKLAVGMVFGRLTLTSVYPTLASCSCGSVVPVKATRLLIRGDKKSCGCLNSDNGKAKVRRILSAYRLSKGRDADLPMQGENKRQRSVFKKEVVPFVFKRDNHTCALCGVRGKKLNAHHIEPWHEAPMLRLDPLNVITLCIDCHIPIAHQGNVRGPVCEETKAKLKNILRIGLECQPPLRELVAKAA